MCLVFLRSVLLRVSQKTILSFRSWLENASGFTSYTREPSLLWGILTSQPSTNRSAPHKHVVVCNPIVALINDHLLNPSPERLLLTLSFWCHDYHQHQHITSTVEYFPHCVDAKCYQNLGFSNVNNFILLYWITFVKTHGFVLILNAIVLVMLKVKNAVLKW